MDDLDVALLVVLDGEDSEEEKHRRIAFQRNITLHKFISSEEETVAINNFTEGILQQIFSFSRSTL
nr:unnamed protein product [Callosobruchus chinensis]